MPLYGGIDLHANNSVVVLLNEQDEVIYQKRLANDLPTILGQLAPYHPEMRVWWWSPPTTGTGLLMEYARDTGSCYFDPYENSSCQGVNSPISILLCFFSVFTASKSTLS